VLAEAFAENYLFLKVEPGIWSLIMSEKPSIPLVLSFIGGGLVVVGGLLWAAFGTLITIFLGIGFFLYVFLVFGLLILLDSVLMYSNPNLTKTWGIVVLVLGVCSDTRERGVIDNQTVSSHLSISLLSLS
jgi:hypothetical protein